MVLACRSIRRRDSIDVSITPPSSIIVKPTMSSSWMGAPVNGRLSLPSAIFEVVDVAVVAAVNGRADEPATVVGVVLDDDTCAGVVVVVVAGRVVVVVDGRVVVVVGVVVVVVVLVVVVVVVDEVVVVVVVGGGQSSIDRRIPDTTFHGFGPTRTSTWMTPQNGGNATLNVPLYATSVPTTGFPGTFGSFTNSTQTQAVRTIGQSLGIVNCASYDEASIFGIDCGAWVGRCARTAHAVPADTREAPAAIRTIARTTSDL